MVLPPDQTAPLPVGEGGLSLFMVANINGPVAVSVLDFIFLVFR